MEKIKQNKTKPPLQLKLVALRLIRSFTTIMLLGGGGGGGGGGGSQGMTQVYVFLLLLHAYDQK